MSWLLLILTLSTKQTSARMRAWRALKACGAAVLRDGVYVLPAGEAHQKMLAGIAVEVETSGGTAYLLTTEGGDHTRLFDRTTEYATLDIAFAEILGLCQLDLEVEDLESLARRERKLGRVLDALVAIDFFPSAAQARTLAGREAVSLAIHRLREPGEPQRQETRIGRLDRTHYQGRVWATRARPWVDRLASAWLIQRFIDPAAQFLWLASPVDCPADALGFDFDGAAFTHVGDKVSFETLLATFDLENDAGLARMARIVHFLDVGGVPVPEAVGLEAVLAGMRSRVLDDDALWVVASQTLDFLYTTLNGKISHE